MMHLANTLLLVFLLSKEEKRLGVQTVSVMRKLKLRSRFHPVT